MKTLFINIKELLQIRDQTFQKVSGSEMAILPSIKNAFLIIEDHLISDFGAMQIFDFDGFDEIIDVSGKMILPTWCDSHTHLVFAENREQEFVDRINGLTYEKIANRGGGILNSVKRLQETSEEDLYNKSKTRLEEIMRLGTGAVEIKSGYGLNLESELKILRVIKKLKQNYSIEIKATFLGAHAFPEEFKNNRNGYIDSIINEMIPKIAVENLAEFIDVFCETGYFSTIETDSILKAGIQFGLIPKIHVNQFNSIGGIKIGIQNHALSVDHLEVMKDEDFEILKNSETMPVALPLCSFFLGIPYTPARRLISEGLPIAIASDFNPGTTPSGNMNFVVATSCIKLKITPQEAINAATINGAFAMGVSKTHGSFCIGKSASFIITKPINSFYELPYSFGSNLIETVFIKGKKI